MTVSELIEAKNNGIDVITRTYVPVREKIKFIDVLISEIINYSEGIVTYDSITRKISLLTTLVVMYTDVEIVDAYEAYDELLSSGVLVDILKDVESDYREFVDLFDAKFNDVVRQHNSLEAVVNRNVMEIGAQLINALVGVANSSSDLADKIIPLFGSDDK